MDTILLLISPQTNAVGFKPVLFSGKGTAAHPFFSIISSIPTLATPPFLAENQTMIQYTGVSSTE
jgi:hypothetical protein